jgi:hypothetical protein
MGFQGSLTNWNLRFPIGTTVLKEDSREPFLTYSYAYFVPGHDDSSEDSAYVDVVSEDDFRRKLFDDTFLVPTVIRVPIGLLTAEVSNEMIYRNSITTAEHWNSRYQIGKPVACMLSPTGGNNKICCYTKTRSIARTAFNNGQLSGFEIDVDGDFADGHISVTVNFQYLELLGPPRNSSFVGFQGTTDEWNSRFPLGVVCVERTGREIFTRSWAYEHAGNAVVDVNLDNDPISSNPTCGRIMIRELQVKEIDESVQLPERTAEDWNRYYSIGQKVRCLMRNSMGHIISFYTETASIALEGGPSIYSIEVRCFNRNHCLPLENVFPIEDLEDIEYPSGGLMIDDIFELVANGLEEDDDNPIETAELPSASDEVRVGIDFASGADSTVISLDSVNRHLPVRPPDSQSCFQGSAEDWNRNFPIGTIFYVDNAAFPLVPYVTIRALSGDTQDIVRAVSLEEILRTVNTYPLPAGTSIDNIPRSNSNVELFTISQLKVCFCNDNELPIVRPEVRQEWNSNYPIGQLVIWYPQYDQGKNLMVLTRTVSNASYDTTEGTIDIQNSKDFEGLESVNLSRIFPFTGMPSQESSPHNDAQDALNFAAAIISPGITSTMSAQAIGRQAREGFESVAMTPTERRQGVGMTPSTRPARNQRVRNGSEANRQYQENQRVGELNVTREEVEQVQTLINEAREEAEEPLRGSFRRNRNENPFEEVVRRETDRVMNQERVPNDSSTRHSQAVSRDSLKAEEIISLAKKLANLVLNGSATTMDAIAIANTIDGLLNNPSSVKLKTGKVLEPDLVTGGMYIAHGWGGHDFDFTYLGKNPKTPEKISIKRKDGKITEELLGDLGLAAYVNRDNQVHFWHPANWTEGTGLSEGSLKKMMDAIDANAAKEELPTEDDDDGI